MGESVLRSIQAVVAGKAPEHVVNRDVIDAPKMQEKLRRYRERTEQA